MIFKTNVKVSINTRTLQEEYVYMDIWSTQKEDDKYKGKIKYYWIKETDTGYLDENDNPIIKYEEQILEGNASEFSIAQARYLQDMYYPNGLPGDYEDEHLDALTEAVANYKMNLPKEQGGHPYGLDSSGWIKQ